VRTKVIILFMLTVPLTILWKVGYLVSSDVYYTVDWFPFAEYPQHPCYYFLWTGHLLTAIIFAYIAHILVKKYEPNLRHITVVFLVFNILRLVEYWGWAGQTPIWQTLGCLGIYCMGYYTKLKWQK
jgi:hypothetical protein